MQEKFSVWRWQLWLLLVFNLYYNGTMFAKYKLVAPSAASIDARLFFSQNVASFLLSPSCLMGEAYSVCALSHHWRFSLWYTETESFISLENKEKDMVLYRSWALFPEHFLQMLLSSPFNRVMRTVFKTGYIPLSPLLIGLKWILMVRIWLFLDQPVWFCTLANDQQPFWWTDVDLKYWDCNLSSNQARLTFFIFISRDLLATLYFVYGKRCKIRYK